MIIDRNPKQSVPKIIIIVSIELLIALIHIIRPGQYLSGTARNLWFSYFSDLAIPFGAYFLLALNEPSFPFLRKWYVKAGIVFILAATAELCQLFGIEALGVTFDIADIIMYACGALLAAFADRKLFAKLFPFWSALS